MQSVQESILEEFMQRSFGAQNLFIPKKYSKGGATREPADLAWVCEDFIALFYMKGTNETLDRQVEGNRKQAKGFHRMWATTNPSYALRGVNRFGDECFERYNEKQPLIHFLIVSNKCGVFRTTQITNVRPNLVLVIPDQLLHWISEFGGTMTDLLMLIKTFTEGLLSEDVTSENAFSRLKQHTISYIEDSLSTIETTPFYLTRDAQFDFIFIYEMLSRMRLPSNIGTEIYAKDAKKFRKLAGCIFGDLTLPEFASLAVVSKMVLDESSPPIFKKSVKVKIAFKVYSFVIYTCDFQDINFTVRIDEVIKLLKNEQGLVDGISIQYANCMGVTDYRIPFSITFPPVLPKSHSLKLIQDIL
jgi:hypothetical protein